MTMPWTASRKPSQVAAPACSSSRSLPRPWPNPIGSFEACGGKASFEKIVNLIYELENEAKKEDCDAQIDETEDTNNVLKNKVSDIETALDYASAGISNTIEVAAAMKNGGHFDKIMDIVDEMITALRREEAGDICPQGALPGQPGQERQRHRRS